MKKKTLFSPTNESPHGVLLGFVFKRYDGYYTFHFYMQMSIHMCEIWPNSDENYEWRERGKEAENTAKNTRSLSHILTRILIPLNENRFE